MNRWLVPLTLAITFCCNVVVAANERRVGHMVFFTLAENTPKHREQLVAACNKHLNKHEGVVYFSAGSIAQDLRRGVNDRDFHVALHLVFANKKAHDQYQTHPRHLKFIEENKQLWSKVRVFDSYIDAPGKSSTPAPADIEELLAAKVTVEFDQKSLYFAAEEIQNQVQAAYKFKFPFQIVVNGQDLRFEGITRNQAVRNFSHRDKPLAEILTALVVLANPAKSAKPSDANQKLVWVIAPDNRSVQITTRRAAQMRSDDLPESFETPKRK